MSKHREDIFPALGSYVRVEFNLNFTLMNSALYIETTKFFLIDFMAVLGKKYLLQL